MKTEQLAKLAKKASIYLASQKESAKNHALIAVAEALHVNKQEIIKANKQDIEEAIKTGLAEPLLKRLYFGEEKINSVIEGIHSLKNLPEPVGRTLSATELDQGLELYKESCPIGVIGVIFESRPDALVQISSLCLKSGNAVILKGGSEAQNTNRILTNIITEASQKTGIPEGWIQLLESREEVRQMLQLDAYIDLIIPRGSNEFVKYIMTHSDIPVLGHADGICHVFIDKDADMQMALDIAFDSKTQYVAVCNAAETILVHESVSKEFLPLLKEKFDNKSVEIFGCEKTSALIDCAIATEESYKTEYLDYKVSIKVVAGVMEAIDHINTYGSGHTDAIVTRNKETANHFMDLVDSGDVFWNCSTRFSDGFRYGLGAEVGISTNKIHARGPVGLEGLMIYKWKLIGNGHISATYAEGKKKFTHRKLR